MAKNAASAHFAITSMTKKKFNNPITRMKGKWALKENVTNCIDPNLCYDAPPGANLIIYFILNVIPGNRLECLSLETLSDKVLEF
jgi:hypothetical protein